MFHRLCGDQIVDVFRAFSMEHAASTTRHPITRHNRDLEAVAHCTARQVARQLGIPDPIVRWFPEFDYDDPAKITLSGVAFPYYGPSTSTAVSKLATSPT